MNEILELFIMIITFLLITTVIFLTPLLLIEYYSSCQEAIIFNELNQTEYTCQDFFWAGDQINSNTQIIKLK